MPKTIIIKAKELFDGKTKRENVYVIVEGNKIVDILSNSGEIQGADYEGFVTPALIDAHSHIGMSREGENQTEDEINDRIDLILPTHNPINSVYFDDTAFQKAVDFGVLYSCIVPGSGNLIGGKAIIIKNFVGNRRNAIVKDYGYKMAFGFNPRGFEDWGHGIRPDTRMGVYAILEKHFDEVLLKQKRIEAMKERELREFVLLSENKRNLKKEIIKEKKLLRDQYNDFTVEEKALLDILLGEKIVKVHLHKEDDVLYLIEFVKKFKIRVTAEHVEDVFNKNIFNLLAKNNIPIVYGPIDSFPYKSELKNCHYKNVVALMKSKAFYGLMSDHPVVLAMSLRDTLKFFMIQGMSDAEAISLITYKNAKLLGIDDMLGTIEPGKLASIVVWDKHPLYLGSFPSLILGEGKILKKKG